MNKVLKNFMSTSVANIIGQLIGFLSITYYSKILLEYNYGMISFAQTFILYFTAVVLFGIQTFGTKLVVNKEKEYNKLTSELFSFRLLIAVVCVIICFVLSLLVSDDPQFPLILILWSLILLPTSLNFDWFFSGIQDMKHNAVYNLFKTVVPAIIIFALVKCKDDIYVVPVAMVMGVLLGGIYYVIILRKHNIKIKFTISQELFIFYFKMGIPFVLSGLLSMVNGNIDKLILGLDKSRYEQLATYQAGYNFVNFIVTFIGVIFLPLFPYIVTSYSRGASEIRKTLQTVSKVVLLITIPISIGGFLTAEDIISFFYHGEYLGAAMPFKILMLYIFIFSIREVYAYSLNGFGLEKKYLKIIGISAFFNFLLNAIFTPRYGYIIAAIITAFTEVINLILMRREIMKIASFSMVREVVRIMIPSIFMAGALIITKNYISSSIFVTIPISIVVYFVFIFLFKTVDIKELRNNLD